MLTLTTDTITTGATVVSAQGRLDLAAAADFRALVADTVEEGHVRVVVDLSRVTFLDSSGIGALISGLRATRQAGGGLSIVGAAAQVRVVLELTKVDQILQSFPDVETALRASDGPVRSPGAR